jgi:hypothetical protein
MRRAGGLPPGTIITYWWTIKDASGMVVETVPVEFLFDDTDYSWQGLTDGKVELYWYEGDESFAQELMGRVKEALDYLYQSTGASLERPVCLYIYGNTLDLRRAMIFPQEWTGGVAYPAYGTIAIGINPDNLSWGKRAISHELTHLVIHQMTLNPYNDLPTWLDEGLAMYSEGEFGENFKEHLDRAIAEDRLISVQSLSSPFSALTEQSYLSYAQSYSLVEFLISTYGSDKMLELLRTFREGSGYDAALEKVYGFDMDGLDILWRQHLHSFQTVNYIEEPALQIGQ